MTCVKYTMSQDPSGYGQAARSFVNALYVAGVNVTTEQIKQMNENTDFGLQGDISNRLKNRKVPYRIKIIHLTPDIYPQYMEDGNYHIGHLFWETDRLPKEWIDPCNAMDEIWTASNQMAEMIQKSGVTTPCYSFPQPIDTMLAKEVIKPFSVPHQKDFTFYAIAQWIDRKGFETLIKAYWEEFTNEDNVTLLLKTYRITYLPEELRLIREEIERWRREVKLSHYPKIYLVHKLLTDQQVLRFHALGDVFIQPSRGEGWSKPTQEAMLLKKPVISGDIGGITDYLTPQYYVQVNTMFAQANAQAHIPWYTAEMQWRLLDQADLRKRMRDVYEDSAPAKIRAKKAQNYVIENFNFLKVGTLLKERLEKIEKQLLTYI